MVIERILRQIPQTGGGKHRIIFPIRKQLFHRSGDWIRGSWHTSQMTSKPGRSSCQLGISIPLYGTSTANSHTFCLPSSPNCPNSHWIPYLITKHTENINQQVLHDITHMVLAPVTGFLRKEKRFWCWVALCWLHNALLLAKSPLLARRSPGPCQHYTCRVQCMPKVSSSEGWTGVTHSSSGLEFPPMEVSDLPVGISGVPDCQICYQPSSNKGNWR